MCWPCNYKPHCSRLPHKALAIGQNCSPSCAVLTSAQSLVLFHSMPLDHAWSLC